MRIFPNNRIFLIFLQISSLSGSYVVHIESGLMRIVFDFADAISRLINKLISNDIVSSGGIFLYISISRYRQHFNILFLFFHTDSMKRSDIQYQCLLINCSIFLFIVFQLTCFLQ